MRVKRFTKGELLTAARMNELIAAINSNEVSVGGGLQLYRGPGGTCINVQERNQAVPFKNANANTCPAYGVLPLTGITLDTGMPFYFTADRPGTTFYRYFIVNGPNEVAQNEVGYGYIVNGSQNRVCIAAYDSGSPACGEEWGPKPSQFTLSKGYPGCFTVLGILDSTNKWMLGYLHPVLNVFGMSQGAIAKDATNGVVEVFSGQPNSGASIISSMTITSVCNPWDDIADNKLVGVNWRNGYPTIDAREC